MLAAAVGLQIAMGAVMVVVALAMLGNYDIRFQNTIASDLPSFLVNPTEEPGEHRARRKRALADLRGISPRRRRRSGRCGAGRPALPAKLGSCRSSARRRNSSTTSSWFNTPGDRPLTLSWLRGRVVLVDFWTYSCINCMRTLPYLTAWDTRYRKDGLTIVGVHSPEFPFEKDASNVEEAIERNGIHYPVAQDNELATWNAYGNQYWPAEYFIDAKGNVRYVHFGEGEYGKKEQVIRELLAEAGGKVRPQGQGRQGQCGTAVDDRDDARDLPRRRPRRTLHQPDALAGHARFQRPEVAAAERIRLPRELADRARLGDRASGGSLDLNFGARRVYLVLGSPGTGPQGAGDARRQADLDGRRRLRRPRRRRRPSTRSASTTSSTCRGSNTTSSNWSRKPG